MKNQETVDAWLLAPENVEAHRTFLAAEPVLSPLQQRLLVELRERGVTHVRFTDLVDDHAQWRVMDEEIHAWLRMPAVQEAETAFRALAPAQRRKDDYIFRHFRRQGEQVTLPWSSPWLQAAIAAPILDLVNHYFTLMSHVYHLDLWCTFADAHEGPRVAAQNWHRDRMDFRLIKAFLYFTDVDLGSGALQYVPGSRRSDAAFGNVWTEAQHRNGYPPADEFASRIPEGNWTTCAHPAGTLVLVDTTGYHRGGRAVSRNRVFATWAYGGQTAASDRFVVDRNSVPNNLTPAARFALFRAPAPATKFQRLLGALTHRRKSLAD